MARARQEGSSPEPVEGLARDGPRPFPLSRLVPSAVSCGLCEPGLPAAPAAPALLPAAYLCAPTAPPAVTAALGAPRWPGGPRSRPRGPRPDGECPPRTRDAGSWERETRRNRRSGSEWGEVASRPGHGEGVASVVFVLQEAGRLSGRQGVGGGRMGSPSWNLTAVPELQPTVFSGPGATAVSKPPSPGLGPLKPPEDCSWREWAEMTVTSGQWGGVEGGLLPFICISLARARPLCSPAGGRRGGGAMVWGKGGRRVLGREGLKVPCLMGC